MKIVSPSGRTYQWDKDSPPTEADFKALQDFEAQAAPQAEPKTEEQELVGGTPEQMLSQQARNIQKQFGLDAPVNLGSYEKRINAKTGETTSSYIPAGLPLRDRAAVSFAPTAQDALASLQMKYGENGVRPINDGRFLVKVGNEWRVDDPVGFEPGDIAGFAGRVPEIGAGIAAAARVPGPQAGFMEFLRQSGISSAAGQAVGGLQDVAFRAVTDQPIQPGEIAKRRGAAFVLESGAGAVIPFVAGRVAENLASRKAGKSWIEAFTQEGDEAKKRLMALTSGNSPTAADVADELRQIQQTSLGEADAGNLIAAQLNKADEALRGASETAYGSAIGDIQRQAALVLKPIQKTDAEVGSAIIGGVRSTFDTLKKSVEKQYGDALAEISQAAGGVKDIIKLKQSGKLVDELEARLLKTVDDAGQAQPLNLYLPMLTAIRQLKQAAGTPQSLEAARQFRSMIGEKLGGDSEIFKSLPKGTAGQLYKSLSDDIDDSIRALTGPGADKLKAANDTYKKLLAPIEGNDYLRKVANAEVNNPEDVIDFLANRAGTQDWAALFNTLPKQAAEQTRRAVARKLMEGPKVSVAGKDYADVSILANRLKGMQPEVKDMLFGAQAWKPLEKMGEQMEFLKSKAGLFTNPSLPSFEALAEAHQIARAKGYDSSIAHLKKAMELAGERRAGMADSLVSQIRNGNVKQTVADPQGFFHSVVMSGRYGPEQIGSVMNKLPADTKEEIGRVAFQTLFDEARDKADAVFKNQSGRYSVDAMVRQMFGTPRQEQTARIIMGDSRVDLIKDWAKYQINLQAKASRKAVDFKALASTAALAPYQNLFAARLTARALESAAGHRVIAGATPDMMERFAVARKAELVPSSLKTVAYQKIASEPLFQDYKEMVADLTREQIDAIDSYLQGR